MSSPTMYRLPPEAQRQLLALGAASLKLRAEAEARSPSWVPQPHQVPPEGDWTTWVMLGGRGAGKTDAGAHYVDAHANGPACIPGDVPHRIAIVAPSNEDAVETCVRGDSGLLNANRRITFMPGARKSADLTWPNGAEARMFGAFAPEDVERFRGPQHCLVWADELAAWRKLDDSWDMIQYGLRLGDHPHLIATTTPKRRTKLLEVLAEATTVISRARTADNPFLPQHRRDALYLRYGGTTMGRQELDAEILDDVVGALWNRALIIVKRPPYIMRHGDAVPDMTRLVVAIDPAVTSTEDSDETGIVVDGIAVDGHGYTLADLSGRMAPVDWARRAIRAYHDFGADRIVAEANNGGDLVSTVIAQLDPMVPVTLVHASKGKMARAQPIAMLYEQGRWYHAETFPELEDQMCSYTGEPGSDSPDRLDAHVWAASHLFGVGGAQWGQGVWGGSVGAVTA